MVRATEMEIGEFRVGQHWILLDVLGSGLRDHRTAGRHPDRVAQTDDEGHALHQQERALCVACPTPLSICRGSGTSARRRFVMQSIAVIVAQRRWRVNGWPSRAGTLFEHA
jgi:hypothetical protein